MEKVLEVNNVTKQYQMGVVPVHALRGVSFELFAGEFVVILGPSGSGKSTMLNIIGGIDNPSSGKEIEETTRALYNADFLPRQDLTEAEKTVHDIERSLMDMTIKSPVSGVISKLNIKDTNVVNLANPIAVITAERDCVVETYVHIKDMSAIEPGKKVILVLEGRSADKEIPGTIISIEDHAVIQISVLGVEERKVKVTIAPGEYGELKDGYDLDVRFNYYPEENKFTVPKTAVFTENDIETLWVVKNGKTQKIHVQKGMELRTEFVIESGLNSGDIVIVDANVKGLKNGVKIQV